jgi:hypothetical protein
MEQIAHIINLSLQNPESVGVPINHWTAEELACKAIKDNIVESISARQTFLEDENHRIRIVYTPKHASWLNQIEIWFGILSRKILGRRASFKSVQELEGKILDFIKYYNENLAKPFKWNYAGKILKA